MTFNTQKGPKAVGPYSTAVVHRDTIYLSGMLPIDPQNGKLIDGSIEDQAHQAFKNIKTVLEELESDLTQVLKVTLFLADMNDFKAVNEVYKDYFGPNFPARSAVQVARLPLDARIEAEVTAAK
ncbi:MAG TPA: RidA family protein [Clostridiaceae bacterium]|nr:RidA family protein [Clostridiaceae bacterium]